MPINRDSEGRPIFVDPVPEEDRVNLAPVPQPPEPMTIHSHSTGREIFHIPATDADVEIDPPLPEMP